MTSAKVNANTWGYRCFGVYEGLAGGNPEQEGTEYEGDP